MNEESPGPEAVREKPAAENEQLRSENQALRTQVEALGRDIAARRGEDAAARGSAEQLRLIVENAREYAIFSLDLGRRITSWNSGAHNILGYTHEEALGQSGDIVFTPEERAAGAPEQEANTALAGGRAADERWHVRKDGSRFWGSGTMMAMHDARQEAIGFVKIFRDQTRELQAIQALEQSRRELKEALRKAEEARQAAEAASKAKDHFVAVLSHELRTPLAPITIALGTLLRRHDLPPPVRRAHEMILRNVQLEAHFIDDLLDLTRIERGKMEVVRAPMNLHEAVERAVEISSPDIEAKRQKLGVALDAADHRVNGDFARLQQALWNLLKNASKFTPPGGSVGLRSYNEADRIVIEVTDSGIGMEADVVTRIFNPFEQANPSISREFGGLGLGLAIAKATVDAHEGDLLASSPGRHRGATFTMSLPLLAPTPPASPRG